MSYRIRVKELREQLGMSQRELAKRMSVTPAAVALWESGTNRVTMDNLLVLADVFNCTLDELFGREPPERTSA